jgi:cyanamide hydratase
MSEIIKAYGWTSTPRDIDAIIALRENKEAPKPVLVSSIELPSSPLAKATLEYARNELPVETFHHSMRVFYYGIVTPYSKASRLILIILQAWQ